MKEIINMMMNHQMIKKHVIHFKILIKYLIIERYYRNKKLNKED